MTRRDYQTTNDEMLDDICARYYPQKQGVVELVLSENPGLAKLGPILPTGTKIKLPNILQETKRHTVQLWD